MFVGFLTLCYINTGGQWEQVSLRGGKELDARLAGHSCVFVDAIRSLVVYGGHRPYLARFSAFS